jgi:hypothetical protein
VRLQTVDPDQPGCVVTHHCSRGVSGNQVADRNAHAETNLHRFFQVPKRLTEQPPSDEETHGAQTVPQVRP